MKTDMVAECQTEHGELRPDADRLVREHLALADRLAARYSSAGRSDDVRQVARLGLVLAANRFDPDKGVFVRFATVTIRGEIKKHFRNTGWATHVTRSVQEDAARVSATIDELTVSLGRAPTTNEVAERLELDREQVVEALRAATAQFATSLDVLETDITDGAGVADTAILAAALQALPRELREAIEYTYRDGLTQAEIGRLIGFSQPQVHRRLAAATAMLKRAIEEVE